MSKKSKKRNGEKYIKCVETIPPDEYEKIPIFQSIMQLYHEYKPQHCRGDDLRFVFQLGNDVKEHEFREICCSPNVFKDSWSDANVLMGVKLVYSDGTWEYGFKYWKDKGIVQRKNSVLRSLYTRAGVINEESKVLEDCMGYDGDTRIPAWIQAMIPMYNERIRDGVQNKDKSIETDDYTLSDFANLCDIVDSSFVTENAKYQEVELKTGTVKMPIGLSFNKQDWWVPITTTWKDKICINEWGEASTMIDHTQVLVNAYRYLKSIYVDRETHRRVYSVFPLSDLFSIRKRIWGERERDFEEVWNNLDQAVAGNI